MGPPRGVIEASNERQRATKMFMERPRPFPHETSRHRIMTADTSLRGANPVASTAFKTSNPAFSPTVMRSLSHQPHEGSTAPDTVTIGGAALKSFILLALLMATAGA